MQVFANPKLTPATLQPDAEGKLINIVEFSCLVQTIKAAISSDNPNEHYKLIAVLSMGWGHSVDEFQEDYSEVLTHYLQHLEQEDRSLSNRWLILRVAWPSGRGGLSHSCKSVLPSRVAARVLGKPLDLAMLPFTV